MDHGSLHLANTCQPSSRRSPVFALILGIVNKIKSKFVYTRCQTVCLSLGSVYQQMQEALQAANKAGTSARNVRLLSISFDVQHDSLEILQKYATRLGADPGLWRFVRVPDPKETQRLLADFQVVVPDGRGDFEHNAALLVVNQQGRLVRIFDYAEQQLALDYARYLTNPVSP